MKNLKEAYKLVNVKDTIKDLGINKLYHVTKKNNLSNILDKGLIPNNGFIYLTGLVIDVDPNNRYDLSYLMELFDCEDELIRIEIGINEINLDNLEFDDEGLDYVEIDEIYHGNILFKYKCNSSLQISNWNDIKIERIGSCILNYKLI